MSTRQRALIFLALARCCIAEEAEVCAGDDCAAVLLLQDRLAFGATDEAPYRRALPSDEDARPMLDSVRAPAVLYHAAQSASHRAQTVRGESRRSASSLLQAEVEELQAELAAEEQLLSRSSSKQHAVSQSAKHFTGILIGLVMTASVLLFAVCMSMSLGLWQGGDKSEGRRRLSCGDWVVGLGVSAVLLIIQLSAFHQTGMLRVPTEGDFSPEIVALSILVTCAGPVACLACLKCHTSLEHLDDEFGLVERRFDRLEKIVSAGFSASLREEQAVLDSIKRQMGR